jgi:hypothetical protein
MTQNVFKLWLTAFDRRMDGRKVILFLDNCSVHIKNANLEKFNIQLKNTTLLYLPPNTTSKIQPCDAGIIRTFKAYYHCRFNNQLLSRIESSVVDPEKINLLDDIQNAIAAWKQDVQSTTIKNCFQHYQLRLDATATQEIEPPAELVAELEEQIHQFHYCNPMEIHNLLNYPDKETVANVPTDDITEAIIEQFQPSPLPAENDNDDDSQEFSMVTSREASEMLSKLQLFWTQQKDSYPAFVDSIVKMNDRVRHLHQNSLKQRPITGYFHHN